MDKISPYYPYWQRWETTTSSTMYDNRLAEFGNHGGFDVREDGTTPTFAPVKVNLGGDRFVRGGPWRPLMPPNSECSRNRFLLDKVAHRGLVHDVEKVLRDWRPGNSGVNRQVMMNIRDDVVCGKRGVRWKGSCASFERLQHLLIGNKRLAKQNSSHNLEWMYSGGCAKWINGSLMCVRGECLDKLSVGPVSVIKRGCPTPDLDNFLQVDVGCTILQVDAADVDEKMFCAVRCEKSAAMFEMSSTFRRLFTFKCTVPLSSVCASADIPGEMVFSDIMGKMAIKDGVVKQVIFQRDGSPGKQPSWCRAYYGSHPRQVLFATETEVAVLDCRAATTADFLLSFPNPLLPPHDRVVQMCPYSARERQHVVVTHNSVLIFDERRAKTPVLSWSSTMTDPAHQVLCLDDGSIICSSQESRESFCVVGGGVGATMAPLCGGPAWRLDADVAGWAQDVPDVSPAAVHGARTRLRDSFLTGLCAIPESVADDEEEERFGVAIVQATSNGDILYQMYRKFSYKEHDGAENCKHLDIQVEKDWLDAVTDPFSPTVTIRSAPVNAAEAIVNEHVVDKMSSEPPHPLCPLCNGHAVCRHVDSRGDDNDGRRCPRCRVQLAEAKDLAAAAQTPSRPDNATATTQLFAHPDVDWDKFTDSLAHKIRKLWAEGRKIRAGSPDASRCIESSDSSDESEEEGLEENELSFDFQFHEDP